jgi:hypothetical protein
MHDQARALYKDAIAAGVLADKVRHESTQLGLDHFHFLIGAGRHSFETSIRLSGHLCFILVHRGVDLEARGQLLRLATLLYWVIHFSDLKAFLCDCFMLLLL